MGHYESPESAYWDFFNRFNAKDADGWAGVMSYPHVRVSAGGAAAQNSRFFRQRTVARFYSTEKDYASTADQMGWERFEATGWVRTRGAEPRRVFESDDQVLLAGGWIRLRADDTPIISNRVLYTCTRFASGWGIQARFGLDNLVEGKDRSACAAAATSSVETAMAAVNSGRVEDWLECFHFPVTIVTGPGLVAVPANPGELRAKFGHWINSPSPKRFSVEVIAAGETGVLIALSIAREHKPCKMALLVSQQQGVWKTLAVTALR